MASKKRSSVPSTKIPWISVLCALLRGTDTLREYLLELFSASQLRGVSRVLVEDVAKGNLGLPMVREFERKQILVDQPLALHIALAKGEKGKARKLQHRLARWRVQFQEVYGEPPETGANRSVLKRHTARACELSHN
ncbi:MAG: hypothetical protein G01um101449_446 [Parcubacteria group bacterium Gr01-1014_49]|nr:MAG: hypothetical protein G01um101449_446 [Parcubacteria group bacterium Gr01-1014_49]